MPCLETVFDGSRFQISAGMVVGMIIVGIGVLLLVDLPVVRRWLHADRSGQIPFTKPHPGGVPITRLGLMAVLCGSLWIAHVVMSERNANAWCRALLASGKSSVVEGPIHDTWYAVKSRGFSVNDINFSYSYSIITGGFRGYLLSNPIRNGAYARIYYVGNVIIKMQIRR